MDEKTPLLGANAIGVPVAAKEPRQFKGPWWHVLGDFGAADVSASCLAWNAPWVAYGWNAQRGLGLTWWKEALKLLLLTCGVFALMRVLLVVLVETQCHGLDLHGPMRHHHGPWGHGHMMHHRHDAGPMVLPAAVAGAGASSEPFDPSAGVKGSVVDASTQTAAVEVNPDRPHHPHDDDDNDRPDDHHHHGYHHHDHKHEHGGFWADLFGHGPRPDTHHKGDADKATPTFTVATTASATTTSAAALPASTASAAATVTKDVAPVNGDNDDDDDDDDEDKDDDHDDHDDDDDDDEDDFDFDKLSPEQRDALRRCAVRVAPWAVALISLGVSAMLYAVYLAALRRRQLRERFGIDGTFKGDLALWLCCTPCVLAQETRTLMYNNVEEGLWHGPLQVMVGAAPRQVQPMTA